MRSWRWLYPIAFAYIGLLSACGSPPADEAIHLRLQARSSHQTATPGYYRVVVHLEDSDYSCCVEFNDGDPQLASRHLTVTHLPEGMADVILYSDGIDPSMHSAGATDTCAVRPQEAGRPCANLGVCPTSPRERCTRASARVELVKGRETTAELSNPTPGSCCFYSPTPTFTPTSEPTSTPTRPPPVIPSPTPSMTPETVGIPSILGGEG